MIRHAANFSIDPANANPGYPLPMISHFTSRMIDVETASGSRAATEVIIYGANFLTRAVDPSVLINGRPLVRYRIAEDNQSITGYLFGEVNPPIQIVVDYGLGVRCEWTEAGTVVSNGSTVSPAAGATTKIHVLRILLWLLVILLLILLLAIVLLVLGGVTLSALGWGLIIAAEFLDVAALLLVWNLRTTARAEMGSP